MVATPSSSESDESALENKGNLGVDPDGRRVTKGDERHLSKRLIDAAADCEVPRLQFTREMQLARERHSNWVKRVGDRGATMDA